MVVQVRAYRTQAIHRGMKISGIGMLCDDFLDGRDMLNLKRRWLRA